VTWVAPASGSGVRLDVRDLVKIWRRRDRADFGVAVVAEGRSATGVTLAFAPRDVSPDRLESDVSSPAVAVSSLEPRPTALASVGDPRHEARGPALELYVK
jgi:hypothetical protein